MLGRPVPFLLSIAIVSTMIPSAALAASRQSPVKPAIVISTNNLGKVLATRAKLGIYYGNTEKKAGGKIKCKGACADQWPPVYVKAPVTKHLTGVVATFGAIRRAGKLQLTINGLPAYTYHADAAGVVTCDNVDGWFAVRVH